MISLVWDLMRTIENIIFLAIKFYRAAMQLVPDIEFRMAPKTTQPTTVNIIPGDRYICFNTLNLFYIS